MELLCNTDRGFHVVCTPGIYLKHNNSAASQMLKITGIILPTGLLVKVMPPSGQTLIAHVIKYR